MADRLIRSLARRRDSDTLSYRLLIVDSSTLTEHARVIHQLKPMATLALGRALTGGALLGGLVKSERNVNLQLAGDGPLGTIFVDVPAEGQVRGYVANDPTSPLRIGGIRPNLGLGLGQNGYVNVMRADAAGRYHRGTVVLKTGEIDDDIAEYLKTSDQVESALALDVVQDENNHIVRAAGVLLQALPSENTMSLDWAREKMRSRHFYKLLEQHPDDWVIRLLAWLDLDTEALTETPLEYRCNCSENRVMAALMAMGADELTDMIAKEGKAEIKCDFCRREFAFNRDQLSKMRDLAVSVALSHENPETDKDN